MTLYNKDTFNCSADDSLGHHVAVKLLISNLCSVIIFFKVSADFKVSYTELPVNQVHLHLGAFSMYPIILIGEKK